MELLSARDFAGLQKAILGLYSHRDIEGFRRAVPGIFLGLIRADHFSLCDARLQLGRCTFTILDIWESRTLCVGKLRDALERNLFDHPFTQYTLRHPGKRALLLSDFYSLPQLRRTRLYREALKPAKVGRVLSVGSMGGPGVATLSVTRHETEPDFSARDRRILELLSPHFDQARSVLARETLLRASRADAFKTSGMTARETEVALWLAQGKSNPEIAIILDAQPRTIEKHVERILRKLDVVNRAAAAVALAEIIRA